MTNAPDDDTQADADAAPAAGQPAPLRNTLYRKVTRGRRKLTRGRLLLYRVAVFVAWWAIRAIWASCRVTHVAGREAALLAARESHSLIPVYWHQHMLFGVPRPARPARGRAQGRLPGQPVDRRHGAGDAGAEGRRPRHPRLVDAHRRARPARLLRDHRQAADLAGNHAGRPARSAARVQAGRHHAVADHRQADAADRGGALVARSRFRTWDAFELPLPFSRVAIVYGEPVKAARAMDAAALAGWQRTMATRLLELRRQAEGALERR